MLSTGEPKALWEEEPERLHPCPKGTAALVNSQTSPELGGTCSHTSPPAWGLTVISEHPWAGEQTGCHLAGATWVWGQMAVQESGLQNELCWLRWAASLSRCSGRVSEKQMGSKGFRASLILQSISLQLPGQGLPPICHVWHGFYLQNPHQRRGNMGSLCSLMALTLLTAEAPQFPFQNKEP